MGEYTIGLDFGTESARGVIADTATGELLAENSVVYPHGVLLDALPTGEKLGPEWALQHPGDYVYAVEQLVPSLLRSAGIRGDKLSLIHI